MEIEAAISLVAQWLDAVHVESAPKRIAEMLDRNAAKDGAVLSVGSGLEDIALHESAHAVVAHRLGLQVGRACIRSDASGSAVYAAAEVSADTMLTLVTATLAGVACELIAGVHPWRQQQLAHCHDILDARLRVMEFQAHAPDWNVASRTCATLAICSVLSNWELIGRVASALQTAGELSGQRIAALCFDGPQL